MKASEMFENSFREISKMVGNGNIITTILGLTLLLFGTVLYVIALFVEVFIGETNNERDNRLRKLFKKPIVISYKIVGFKNFKKKDLLLNYVKYYTPDGTDVTNYLIKLVDNRNIASYYMGKNREYDNTVVLENMNQHFFEEAINAKCNNNVTFKRVF